MIAFNSLRLVKYFSTRRTSSAFLYIDPDSWWWWWWWWWVDCRENHWNYCRQMSRSKPKMQQICFGRCSTPDPTGRAYSAAQDPLPGFKGPTSKGGGGKIRSREGTIAPLSLSQFDTAIINCTGVPFLFFTPVCPVNILRWCCFCAQLQNGETFVIAVGDGQWLSMQRH